MRFFRFLALFAIWAAAWCGAMPIQAADILSVKQATIGLGGKCKAGFWQPVWLTLAAGPEGAKGNLEIVAPDGDQMPVAYRDRLEPELNLTAGEERTVLRYFKSGPVGTSPVVRLWSDSEVVWQQELVVSAPIASTRELIVGIGPSIGLEAAAATIRRRAGGALVAATLENAKELPDRWWGYDGVDTLALATSDAEFLAALTGAQKQAIVQWVLMGGRMVFCVGARGEELATDQSVWRPLFPGEVIEVDALRERSGLESFTKTELPFDDPMFQRNRPQVTRLRDIRGEALFDEVSSGAGRPLAVRAAAGLGQVTFVALDLDHPSLVDWKGRPRLVASLLSLGAVGHEQNEHQPHGGISQLGYDDLVGQLRAALDQFPGVSMVNFTTVSVLTCVYLLLIGPGDYLLLSRLALPRQVTWLTFPAASAAMIGVAGYMDGQVHGRNERMNQAEIVDIDLERQMARGTVWCHVYSPATRPYEAQLSVAAPVGVLSSSVEGWLSWQGLPGDALGGLESRQPALIHREPYVTALPGPAAGVEGLTIQVASSKSLSACWWARTSLANESKLTIDRYGLLAGEFRSPLPIALNDCLLAHGEKLYRLGTLNPNQQVRLAELPPLNLEARLTQRRVEQSKDVSTPWEPDSVDIPRIMQMLMFHEAARGTSYTGLTHRYQAKIDFSEVARLGQAVLVGRSEEPVAQLKSGKRPIAQSDQVTTYTWYRIVLPVQRTTP